MRTVPTCDCTALGSAGLAAGNNANALHTFGAGVFGSRPATPNGVAWPPAGYVPYQVLPWDPYFGTLGRWSYSYPGADFSAATVTVTSAGASVPSTVLPVSANSYGDNTVAWSVNVPPTAPAFDKRYNVTVAGIAPGGVNAATMDATLGKSRRDR